MIVYGLSDVGLKRKSNQDSIYYGQNSCGEYLAIVCDGIGGGKAGDVASNIAVSKLAEAFILKVRFISDEEEYTWIEAAVKAVNDIIFTQSTTIRSQKGMGTTLAGVLITNNGTYLFHLGDSRVYGLYDDFVSLTEDHNLASDLLKRGEINEHDAINHPNGNMLTNALGIWDKANVDIVKIKNNYRLLLVCSDGLHSYVDETIIKNLVSLDEPIERRCERLISASKSVGGYDNVSVILIERGEQS